MPTTENYSFYTPPLTGVTSDIPRDMQVLADAIDAALKAEETARIGAWVPFTPKIYAAAAPTTPVASTPNAAACRYMYLRPHVVLAHAEVTITNATVAALIDLPVAGTYRQIGIGVCGLWGSSLPADQNGTAFMDSSLAKLVCAVAYSSGFRDAAAGNVCRYNVTYEV